MVMIICIFLLLSKCKIWLFWAFKNLEHTLSNVDPSLSSGYYQILKASLFMSQKSLLNKWTRTIYHRIVIKHESGEKYAFTLFYDTCFNHVLVLVMCVQINIYRRLHLPGKLCLEITFIFVWWPALTFSIGLF